MSSGPLLTAASRTRKPTNISLAPELIAQARASGLNLSHAAGVDIAGAVARRRQERWPQENFEALESSNAFVEEHGLPLERHRVF